MKYDDASWHYNGNFPKDLPIENGATHIAMFFMWAVDRDLVGDYHKQDRNDKFKQLKAHKINFREYFMDYCDGKFTDEDLNDLGNKFTAFYFKGKYIEDYDMTIGDDLENLYQIEASWENYNRLKPIIDQRFNDWIAVK